MSKDLRRAAIVPGSFDPVTLGHLDLIKRAARLFDEVVVAVLENSSKKPWFSAEARVLMLEHELGGVQGVRVIRFTGLLVEVIASVGADVVVRGVRGGSDLEYETLMARMNAHLRPGLDTVFLPSSPSLTHVASRLVREIAFLGGSVDGLVTERVARAVKARAEEKRAEESSDGSRSTE